MVLIPRKLYLSKEPEWVQRFSGGGGGVQLFPGEWGGPNSNFYRKPYNL